MYELYDVPWLVREPNSKYGSLERYQNELAYHELVDAYFTWRLKGYNANMSLIKTCLQTRATGDSVRRALKWYYMTAYRRGKYTFLQKFPPQKEQIVE